MKLYAISDLHLGFSLNKPMHIFGDNWTDHYMKIKRDWQQRIEEDDLVIVAGDISWAMRMEDARVDLEWLDALPGKKVLIKGNHDYWWQSLTKMQGEFASITFVLNSYFSRKGVAVCGSRGWILPENDEYSEEDHKIYQREVQRLDRSLMLASQDPTVHQIVVAFHYPPLTRNCMENAFTKVLQKYGVQDVVYGHLHDKESWNQSIRGIHAGIHYRLVSSDFTDFSLVPIALQGEEDA